MWDIYIALPFFVQVKEIEYIAKGCDVELFLNRDIGTVEVSGFVKRVHAANAKIEKYLQKISNGNYQHLQGGLTFLYYMLVNAYFGSNTWTLRLLKIHDTTQYLTANTTSCKFVIGMCVMCF